MLDGNIQAGVAAHAAVDIFPCADAHRLVDHRQRRGGGHRGRDRHVAVDVGAEHGALAGIQAGGDDVKFAFEIYEAVRTAIGAQRQPHILIERHPVVKTRWQRVCQGPECIDQCGILPVAQISEGSAQQFRGQPQAAPKDFPLVEVENVLALDGGDIGMLACDDLKHRFRAEPVGQEGRDDGPGAGAHENVKVGHAAIDQEIVDSAQRADLVDCAGHAAASQHQRELTSIRSVSRFHQPTSSAQNDLRYSVAQRGVLLSRL